jgi:hypothetical protein
MWIICPWNKKNWNSRADNWKTSVFLCVLFVFFYDPAKLWNSFILYVWKLYKIVLHIFYEPFSFMALIRLFIKHSVGVLKESEVNFFLNCIICVHYFLSCTDIYILHVCIFLYTLFSICVTALWWMRWNFVFVIKSSVRKGWLHYSYFI